MAPRARCLIGLRHERTEAKRNYRSMIKSFGVWGTSRSCIVVSLYVPGGVLVVTSAGDDSRAARESLRGVASTLGFSPRAVLRPSHCSG